MAKEAVWLSPDSSFVIARNSQNSFEIRGLVFEFNDVGGGKIRQAKMPEYKIRDAISAQEDETVTNRKIATQEREWLKALVDFNKGRIECYVGEVPEIPEDLIKAP